MAELLRFRETWGIVCAKFLTDAAWYFSMFWLPKYLLDARGFALGGALGGVVLGQLAGALLDAGFSHTPVLTIAASLHVAAFLLILATVRTMTLLPINPAHLAPTS